MRIEKRIEKARNTGNALWVVCVNYALENPDFIASFREHMKATRHPMATIGGAPRVSWCHYVASVVSN